MPSFSDSIVLFLLALLLFGPKKLPVLARELGKWIGEFRRASNEFKMQMEEELRVSEQADRTKQIAAMEAAAPVAPALPGPEHPHIPAETASEVTAVAIAETAAPANIFRDEPALETHETIDGVSLPLPIATSGELSIMPPSTGLPTARPRDSALSGLIRSIPEAEPAQEPAAHGN